MREKSYALHAARGTHMGLCPGRKGPPGPSLQEVQHTCLSPQYLSLTEHLNNKARTEQADSQGQLFCTSVELAGHEACRVLPPVATGEVT